MTLTLTNTLPKYYQDTAPPAASYLPDVINQGQPILNSSNGDIYKCIDGSNQNSLVWQKIPNLTDLPQTPVYSSPNFASVTTPTQISTTRDASVNYVFPTTMTSLLTSQSLTATLQYADDSGMSTNLVNVNVDVQGCSGILSLTLSGRLQVSARIPAGKYRRVVLGQTGGATVPTTLSSSQEVLI